MIAIYWLLLLVLVFGIQAIRFLLMAIDTTNDRHVLCAYMADKLKAEAIVYIILALVTLIVVMISY